MNYYNEFDAKAAAWLRELSKAGLIARGEVDERSICDVKADDLKGFTQCHFFAGIGGWSYALRLAGWPDARPVWTGSCPCQPFSAAGKRKGKKDARHLWPQFRRLIGECGPAVVFGEQVASKDGREWLSGVRADLERMGRAVGAADLCAASVRAPHIRQRLWFVSHAVGSECQGRSADRSRAGILLHAAERSCSGHSSDAVRGQRQQRLRACGDGLQRLAEHGATGDLPDAERSERRPPAERPGSAWAQFDVLQFTDGKARRVEAGTFPLAHGVPGRVGLLRGYGNAIVPECAAEFILAYLETLTEIVP